MTKDVDEEECLLLLVLVLLLSVMAAATSFLVLDSDLEVLRCRFGDPAVVL